jgi:hypothetical protein
MISRKRGGGQTTLYPFGFSLAPFGDHVIATMQIVKLPQKIAVFQTK